MRLLDFMLYNRIILAINRMFLLTLFNGLNILIRLYLYTYKVYREGQAVIHYTIGTKKNEKTGLFEAACTTFYTTWNSLSVFI